MQDFVIYKVEIAPYNEIRKGVKKVMASNKFDKGKCKGAEAVKAALRHNDCSPERRAIAAKGNPDIDVARSRLNVNLTGDTYEERCRKYDARIAKLDSMDGANKRKDRVTGQLIETPVPPGLQRVDYNRFLRRVYEIECEKYGKENIVGADIHWDEEHRYTNPKTKQEEMSRVHLQVVVIPVVAGRLCGKEFFSRKNMGELNQAVQKMAQEEFGVDFMDGTQAKGKSSTAELKAASIVARAEVQAEAIKKDAEKRAQKAVEGPTRALESKGAAICRTVEKAARKLTEAVQSDKNEDAMIIRYAKTVRRKDAQGTLYDDLLVKAKKWHMEQARKVEEQARQQVQAAGVEVQKQAQAIRRREKERPISGLRNLEENLEAEKRQRYYSDQREF